LKYNGLHDFTIKIFFFLYGASACFLAMASPISFLQSSHFLAAIFHFRIWSKSMVSLQTTSSHLLLSFPKGLLLPKHSPIPFCGIRESSIITTWPAHFNAKQSVIITAFWLRIHVMIAVSRYMLH